MSAAAVELFLSFLEIKLRFILLCVECTYLSFATQLDYFLLTTTYLKVEVYKQCGETNRHIAGWIMIYSTFWCAVLFFIKVSSEDDLSQKLLNASIMNVPPFFKHHHNSINLGKLQDIREDPNKIRAFDEYIAFHYHHRHKWSDGEAVSVIEKYFWGMREGICIELGALDGDFLSQSKPLSDDLGWNRIIIEGSPKYKSQMALKSPDAFAVSSAICADAMEVHYAEGTSASGIIEFMSKDYLNVFFPAVLSTPKENWTTLPFVSKQSCLPLLSILQSINVMHVNWFLLDVEGAELAILQTIDFRNVTFDVITVETERKFRPPDNYEKVCELMDANGYRKSWDQGRNTWFVRRNWTLFTRPGCVEDREC